MSIGSFILKNALRNRRRALLSILSVSVSLFLLVSLLVTLRELTLPPEDMGAALRVAVRSKLSIANLLPARQLNRIQSIPGVSAVTPFTWFGGKYKNEENMTFAQFAMDAKKLRAVFGEAKMSEPEYKAFESTRDACIIGRVTADKYQFKRGDRLSLESSIYPVTLDFTIAGIYEGTVDDRNMLFHQEYLDEASGNPGWVGMWWLRVASPDDMPRVVTAINTAFANTSAEVRAESERAFQLGFLSMLGNVRVLIGSISAVVVFTLVLVSASTMSMAIRERFRELAILKALGFRRRELFVFILAESVGLCLAGLVVGAGGAWLLFTHGYGAGLALLSGAGVALGVALWNLFQKRFSQAAMNLPVSGLLAGLGIWACRHPNISKMTNGFFITFEVTPKILGLAALVATGLGIVASIAPAIAAARMSVVSGLKTLD